MMGLFENGDFTGHSGLQLSWKIECDALGPEDWKWAAARVAERVDFYDVQAIPRGGIPFARALGPHANPDTGRHLLVVDDVLTTGRSLLRWREENESEAYDPRDILGVVLFSRILPPAPWIKALFVMPEWGVSR